MSTAQELFPLTNNGAILEAFFKDMGASRKGRVGAGTSKKSALTSKVWDDLEILNGSDTVAFFTVAFHHPMLHVVLPECIEASARSITSTSKVDRIPKSSIQALSEIVIRITTGFDGTATVAANAPSAGKRTATFDMTSYCARLQKLFPSSCWMSLAHVLYRQNPPVTTIVMNTLLMHLPSDLPSFKAIAMTWCDQVGLLLDRCVSEAKRGRFMRTNGDILVLFETAFRLSHEMWCLLEAAPIPVAPFLPLQHVLDGLADLTNKITPMLQYFVLHSDDLQSSRKRLSRANALIVNASVRAAVAMTLFTPFIGGVASAANASTTSKAGYANARLVPDLDESLSAQLQQSLPATSLPNLLIRKCGSYLKALKQIIPLMSTDGSGDSKPSAVSSGGRRRGGGDKRRITADHNLTVFDAGSYRLGEVLVALIKDASGETDGGEGGGKTSFACSRFVELLLIELVNQRCSISDWTNRDLVDDYEASLLGGGGEGKRGGTNDGNKTTTTGGKQQKTRKTKGAADDDDEDDPALLAAIAASQADTNSNAATQRTNNGYSASDEDAALAAAIAASRAEAGLAPEDEEGRRATAAASSSSPNAAAATSSSANPAVQMVLDVLPHFTVQQVETALVYYNNNVEALIMDAVSDNLPPHLATSSATSNTTTTTTTTTASSATATASIQQPAMANKKKATFVDPNKNGIPSYNDDDGDDAIPAHLDMFSFLNEIDAADGARGGGNTSRGGGGTEDNEDIDFAFTDEGMGNVIYSSEMYFGGMSALGAMDEDLRHRTLTLAANARLYEDERDDAVDEDDEANRYLAGKLKGDEEDDDSDDEPTAATSGSGGRRYDNNADDGYGFEPAFNNRSVAGPNTNTGGAGGYVPKYTLKSTTFRVGGGERDSRTHGGGKDPRDKKKEKSTHSSGAGGGAGGGSSKPHAADRGAKGAKVNKANIGKLMKSGVLN